jgi:hypothetical protein
MVNQKLTTKRTKAPVRQGPTKPPTRRQPFKPAVVRSKDVHTMDVSHREAILVVNGTSNVNPARVLQFNPGTMPWLQALSTRFEYYEILSATLEVVTGNSSTSPGNYTMSVDYDVTDPDPLDQNQMLNGGNSVLSSMWKDSKLHIRPNDILPKRKLISSGFVPDGSDPKFYDAFSVHWQHGANGYFVVYLSYVIRLTVPQISNAAGGQIADNSMFNTIGSNHSPVALKPNNVDDKLPVKILDSDPSVLASVETGSQMVGVPPNSRLLVAVNQTATGSDASLSSGLHYANATATLLNPITQNAVADAMYSVYEIVTANAWGFIQFFLISASVTMSSQDLFFAKR